MHRRLDYIYLLNVPSFSSRYFNKIKRTSRLGRLLALSLEILYESRTLYLMTRLQYYCILGLAEIKTLHPRDKIIRKRLHDAQVTKSLDIENKIRVFQLSHIYAKRVGLGETALMRRLVRASAVGAAKTQDKTNA